MGGFYRTPLPGQTPRLPNYFTDSSGPLVALGAENGRDSGVNWGIEVSIDDSEVEFENLIRGRNEKINS